MEAYDYSVRIIKLILNLSTKFTFIYFVNPIKLFLTKMSNLGISNINIQIKLFNYVRY